MIRALAAGVGLLLCDQDVLLAVSTACINQTHVLLKLFLASEAPWRGRGETHDGGKDASPFKDKSLLPSRTKLQFSYSPMTGPLLQCSPAAVRCQWCVFKRQKHISEIWPRKKIKNKTYKFCHKTNDDTDLSWCYVHDTEALTSHYSLFLLWLMSTHNWKQHELNCQNLGVQEIFISTTKPFNVSHHCVNTTSLNHLSQNETRTCGRAVQLEAWGPHPACMSAQSGPHSKVRDLKETKGVYAFNAILCP